MVNALLDIEKQSDADTKKVKVKRRHAVDVDGHVTAGETRIQEGVPEVQQEEA